MKNLMILISLVALALGACGDSRSDDPATIDGLELSSSFLTPGQTLIATVAVHGAFDLRQGTLLFHDAVVGEFKLIKSDPDAESLKFSATTQWETLVRLGNLSAPPNTTPTVSLVARLVGASGQTLQAGAQAQVSCAFSTERLCSSPKPACMVAETCVTESLPANPDATATVEPLQLSTYWLVPGQVVTATATVLGEFELRQGTLLLGEAVVGEFKLIASNPDTQALKFSANTQWETLVQLRNESAEPNAKPLVHLVARLIGASGQTLQTAADVHVSCRLSGETMCSAPEPACVNADADPNNCGGCGNKCVASDLACAASSCGLAMPAAQATHSCDYICAQRRYGGKPMSCRAICDFSKNGGTFGRGSAGAFVTTSTSYRTTECDETPIAGALSIACCCVATF